MNRPEHVEELLVTSMAGTVLLKLLYPDRECTIQEVKLRVTCLLLEQGQFVRVQLLLDAAVLKDEHKLMALALPRRATLQAVIATLGRDQYVSLLSENLQDLCILAAQTFMQMSDPKLRSSAVDFLATLDSDRAMPYLVRGLQDDDRELRICTVRAIKNLGRSATQYVKHLEERIKDTDPAVQNLVIETLMKIGTSLTDPEALVSLVMTSPMLRQRLTDSLVLMGEAVVPHLVTVFLRSTDIDNRKRILRILARIGAPAADSTPDISNGMMVENYTRHKTKFKILKVGVAAVRHLLAALNQQNRKFRACALEALTLLTWSPEEDHIVQVVSLLRDTDTDIRSNAINILVRIGTPVLPHLAPMLRDRETCARISALDVFKAVGRWGAPHVHEVAMCLHDHDVFVRRHTIAALREMGTLDSHLGEIEILSDDDDWIVSRMAAEILAGCGTCATLQRPPKVTAFKQKPGRPSAHTVATRSFRRHSSLLAAASAISLANV